MDKALVYGTRDSGFDPQWSRLLWLWVYTRSLRMESESDAVNKCSLHSVNGDPVTLFFHGTNVFFISKQWSNYKHEIALRNIYCGRVIHRHKRNQNR
uniref:Uncharacterized protein n=1 Tax=Populus trichocarpa TaxID=3694 RepID=A0A2K1YP03_POPTR